MLKDISKEEKHFLRDFGEILATRIENQPSDVSENELIDKAALDFGRCLRAARLNAELTVSQLAKKASVAKAEVYALERGLIIPEDITVESLHGLADALDEDIRIFALMLELDIPPLPTKEHLPEQGRTNQDWLAELRGDRGQEPQFMAHQDLADYLYKMAYNDLDTWVPRHRGRDAYIARTFTPKELTTLAQRSVQKTLEKLASDNYALLDQFKDEGRFTSWVVSILSKQIIFSLRELNNKHFPSETESNLSLDLSDTIKETLKIDLLMPSHQ